jgi:DNA-directed RNA polymerase subunit M/transcription elongation factor TFIIS
MVSLDIYNGMLEQELGEEPRSIKNIADIQKLVTEASKNISSISTDLKIDRKSREHKTDSIPDYVRDLKDRAKKFLEQRMYYIYCPKCKTLLLSMWLLDINSGNKFKLTCPNCKNTFVVADSELPLHKNIPDAIVPVGPK